MQRYELVEGTASKFWEVEATDNKLTVRYGRIGTAGTTQTKEFADSAAAIKERDKLIKEKTGKGYSEVKLANPATLAAVAVKPAKVEAKVEEASTETAVSATTATVKQKAAAPASPSGAVSVPTSTSKAEAVAPVESTAPMAAPASLIWPSGGFQWKPEWEALMPIVRGIHAPPFKKQLSLLSSPPTLDDDKYSYMTAAMAAFAQSSGRPWVFWGRAGGKEKIVREALLKPDREYWLELCAQALCNRNWQTDASQWVVNVGLAVHGLTFMADIVMQMWSFASTQDGTMGSIADHQLPSLRHAIAAASDDDYAAVFDLAKKYQSQSDEQKILCAHLFPHYEPWVHEAYDLRVSDHNRLLQDCIVGVERATQYAKKADYYHYYGGSAVVLQTKLHGDAAISLMTMMVETAPDKSAIDKALEFLLAMQTPDMIPVLVKNMERKEVRAALDKVAEKFPAAVLYTAIAHLTTRSRTLEGWTVRLALRKPEALAAANAALDKPSADHFATLLASLDRADAPAEQLPELLKNPPWMSKVRPQELPTFAIEQLPVESKLEWSMAEIEKFKKHEMHSYYANEIKSFIKKGGSKETFLLKKLNIKHEVHSRILSGGRITADDIVKQDYYNASVEFLLELPEAIALALWESYPTHMWYSYSDYMGYVKTLLARLGAPAIEGFARYCQTYPLDGLSIADGIDSTGIAAVAMHGLRNLKKAKDNAISWIRKHPRTTAIVALQQAFGKDKAARDNAQFAIRWMLRDHSQAEFESQITNAAKEYGGEMPAALEALKSADPLNVLPCKMPKLPSFFVPASFRRPELKSGGAMPLAAVEHIGMMLAISKLDAPYIGLEIVHEHCSRESLAEFAWDLFETWMTAGAPSKEGWAFAALGLLGDDESARRLAPKIREWPGEAAHARAVTGLDILAAIGTDVALMHLNAIANKVKFKGLQDRAKEKIAMVAETRGFTTEELADRLVPDLGLDEQGSLELNFGTRQFFMSFDETLKPFVKDQQGVRLKDLPKAIKSDDATLAAAATERFKQMKKDAKAIASMQVTRLELGMVAQRRWSAADFRTFFLDHPVMRFLAVRVVWGVYDKAGGLTDCFRVAEDFTLADKEDSLYKLHDDAIVGIAHVLEIPKELQAAFGQVFADYEIMQPFKQLGRETFTLTDAEKAANDITRFATKEVAVGSVMGLVNRGWERGAAQDGGWVGEFHKRINDQCWVEASLDPGTVVGDLSYEPKQKVTNVVARKPNSWDKDGIVPLASLSPIIASEILRDLELLAPYKE